MSASNQVFAFQMPFDNKHDLFIKFISLFGLCQNLAKGKNYLRPKLVEVLTYYVIRGYSEDTKRYILEHHPTMNLGNLNQINSLLTKKGYLVKDVYKSHMKHLSKDLQIMKDYITKSENPFFIIKLDNNG